MLSVSVTFVPLMYQYILKADMLYVTGFTSGDIDGYFSLLVV